MKTLAGLRHALGVCLLLPVFASAADALPPPAEHPMPGMGMMGHPACPMHRPGGHEAMLRMPHLPPGNEKLQLQMEAEILQKIGEIEGRYAAKLP